MPRNTLQEDILKHHKKELAWCLKRAKKLTKMIEKAEKQSQEKAPVDKLQAIVDKTTKLADNLEESIRVTEEQADLARLSQNIPSHDSRIA